MSQTNQPPHPSPEQTTITAKRAEHYRESYANSVQVRMSVWDFFLVFGTVHQESSDSVTVDNFQGIFLSPQQAKALLNVLGHNLAQYEKTFGPLALEPKYAPPGGPVH
jgi:flagellar protein FlaG